MTTSPLPYPSLVRKWQTLYKSTLPSLARKNRWPVHLDHCFARIIYDAVIGDNGPWTERLQSPATNHMSRSQMEQCIAMAERFATGELNLWEWNALSLEGRGRAKARSAGVLGEKEGERMETEQGLGSEGQKPQDSAVKSSRKRKRDDDILEQRRDIRAYFQKPSCAPSSPPSTPTTLQRSQSSSSLSSPLFHPLEPLNPPTPSPAPPPIFSSEPPAPSSPILQKIHLSPLPPLRKALYSLLLQVPIGRYTTYAHLATALRTSPRAVGSAMRNNPFAPEVPCHRVLASGGKIGGFGGEWGEGKKIERKTKILRGEGVKFDGKGRAVGVAWGKFVVKV